MDLLDLGFIMSRAKPLIKDHADIFNLEPVNILGAVHYVHPDVAKVVNQHDALLANVARLKLFTQQYVGKAHRLVEDAQLVLNDAEIIGKR